VTKRGEVNGGEWRGEINRINESPPFFFFSQNEQDGSRVSVSPTNLKTSRSGYSRLSKVSKDVEDGQVLALRDEAGESGWR